MYIICFAFQDLFQQALDYAKTASEKVYEMLKSLSSVTDYLPTRLRDGATAAVEQVCVSTCMCICSQCVSLCCYVVNM